MMVEAMFVADGQHLRLNKPMVEAPLLGLMLTSWLAFANVICVLAYSTKDKSKGD